MKVILAFIIGFASCYFFMSNSLSGLQKKTSAALDAASDASKSYCRKSFFLETQCYQKHPAARCEQLVKQQCGQ